jgi:hypothetical protein
MDILGFMQNAFIMKRIIKVEQYQMVMEVIKLNIILKKFVLSRIVMLNSCILLIRSIFLVKLGAFSIKRI